MKPKLFKELIESIKEAGAIMRGEKEPARVTKIETTPWVDDGKAWEQLKAEWDEEDKKKNLRNWINHHLPVINGHNPAWTLTHPWELVEDGWREARWAWQRVFRGWDDRVCWGVNYHLADVIPQWMRQMQEVAHGFPATLYDESPTGIATSVMSLPENPDEDPNMKVWKDILEEIAVGFEAYRETDENDYSSIWEKGQEERLVKYEKGFDLFRKYFPDLWD